MFWEKHNAQNVYISVETLIFWTLGFVYISLVPGSPSQPLKEVQRSYIVCREIEPGDEASSDTQHNVQKISTVFLLLYILWMIYIFPKTCKEPGRVFYLQCYNITPPFISEK